MTIYAKTTKELVLDWAQEHLPPDGDFTREPVVSWFAEHYPRTNRGTIERHIEGMCTNTPNHRKHHPHVRSDTNWDHFFKLGPNHYRRYDPRRDPPPVYG